MSTQGLVTVLKHGKVVMKFITGSDGHQAGALAAQLRKKKRVPRLKEAYKLARQCSFGSDVSLVVMGEKRSYHNTGEPLPRLYRQTFNRPRFNPRWKEGTTDRVIIVDL